jgi:Family of unknown function (DUF6348)
MFGARRKGTPELLPSNPGRGSAGKTAFAKAGETWSESFDLIELLASVVRERGIEVRKQGSALELVDSHFVLLPQLAYLQPLEKGGVRTATTIQFRHPTLVPDGCFEYQHSTGDNLQAAFHSGFDQWAQMDLVTLLDSLREMPASCTTLKFEHPKRNGMPGIFRRAVLGPFIQFREESGPFDREAALCSETHTEGAVCEGDDFCPCCFLTRSFEVFKRHIESDRFYGLRFYAARNRGGVPMADCRVNGEDWEEGAAALRRYVLSWPEMGFEFRKQYVVLHSPQGTSESESTGGQA